MTDSAADIRTLPLFERFNRLRETAPWAPIGEWPTPVVNAPKFAIAHGLRSFHIKREDQSHPEFGGNKVRGLEFLLAEARRRDVKTLVTFSSAGSHHVCRTAVHGHKFRMGTVAVIVDQPNADYVHRNLAAGLSMGAKYILANKLTVVPRLIGQLLRYSSGNRAPCMYVPPGGTSPLSCIGHVNAAFELRRQIEVGALPPPDYIYVPLGSLGTAAGLALGCRLAGINARIVGVVVSYRWYCTRGRCARLANRTMRLMRRYDPAVPAVQIRGKDFDRVATALGRGYAQFTESGMALSNELYSLEQIRLDGTYTAKTLDGAIQFIEKNKLHDKRHLFWQTFDSIPAANFPARKNPPQLAKYFTEPMPAPQKD